jgi:hypothetical protein
MTKNTAPSILITIDHGTGKKEKLVLPCLGETTSGYICGEVNEFGAGKGEWFPKDSKFIQAAPIY